MKSFFLLGIVFLSSLVTLSAQEKVSSNNRSHSFSTNQSLDSPTYFLGFGLNVLDDGNSDLPFNANEMSFKVPFFASIERRGATSNFAPVLSFSTNKLKVDGLDRFYFSVDAAARYYFDDYIFKNRDIETYASLGLGHFFLGDKGNNTFNFSIGGRYWFSKNFAVSIEGTGKRVLKDQVGYALSHYAYNAGIVWGGNLRNANKNRARKKPLKEASSIIPIDLRESLAKDKALVLSMKENLIKEKEQVASLKENIIKDKEGVIAIRESLIKEKEIAVALLPPAEKINKQVVNPKLSDSVLVRIATREDYTGDWYINITNSTTKAFRNGPTLYSIYAPYKDDGDGVLWISDFKKGMSIQCKITVNIAKGTFEAAKQRNVIGKGNVIITEGRFEKGAGVDQAGNLVNRIYFKARFSYDPNTVFSFEGNKSTTTVIEDKR
jgi:hypothetical protein